MNQQRLNELLHYDPKTGLFTWRYSRRGIAAGRIAGCLAEDGYIRIRVDGTLYLAQRLAWFCMTGVWPEVIIDHKNGDKSDNSWDNIREASYSQNQMNRSDPNRGVHFCNTRRKWIAKIQKDGVIHYLGSFYNKENAIMAYKQAAPELFGEFAGAA
jgi:hypothetical protein